LLAAASWTVIAQWKAAQCTLLKQHLYSTSMTRAWQCHIACFTLGVQIYLPKVPCSFCCCVVTSTCASLFHTALQALAVALDAQVTNLRAKAGQLQLQAASGSTSTSEAVKSLLGQFSDAIRAIEQNVTAGAASGEADAAANASLQAALQRCRKDAVTGARMVAEAAARQDISSERAVQYLSSLLRQLAADVSTELTQQGKQQQQKPAASRATSAPPARGVSDAAPASAAGFAAAGGASGSAAASDLPDNNEIVVASVDELELVLQDASSQSQVVRAAAKGFAAAEAAAASLQQRLPEFKQALAATAAGGSSETSRQAAARILTGAAGEVEGQLAELQAEMLAKAGGGEAGAAAAASLQLLRDNVEARVRELAGKVETGQVKPTAALDEVRLLAARADTAK
jgi:hypothetical protein